MSHVHVKYKEMGNDTGCFWPKPKKSKISNTIESINIKYTPEWDTLPTIILYDIFSYLPEKDRINASSTCHMWRQSLYHPKFWKDVTFQISSENIERAQYLRNTAAHIVNNAVVKFDSLSTACVNEFMLLLREFATNDNLNSLILEPSHCHLEIPQNILDIYTDFTSQVYQLLVEICRRRPLQHFSLGLNEELLQHMPKYLQLLAESRADKLQTLGLASVKDDPANYLISTCDPILFTPFRELKILSIDYDIVSDTFLESLKAAKKLERLVIHVHGIWNDHPGTTEHTWATFVDDHPNCTVRVSLIHAYDEIYDPEPHFLKKNMPLTHLKVLFCENVNLHLIDYLSSNYSKTLTSIMWVDSLSNDNHYTWNLINPDRTNDHTETVPNPLIMLAWLCKKLEEITFERSY
ncbi:F-box-like [Popillia japonica]|uniref:F-box-like n=1 Tax=Popillia japonica TaxID=7064 RepID=A0AAW1L704_POPJA